MISWSLISVTDCSNMVKGFDDLGTMEAMKDYIDACRGRYSLDPTTSYLEDAQTVVSDHRCCEAVISPGNYVALLG